MPMRSCPRAHKQPRPERIPGNRPSYAFKHGDLEPRDACVHPHGATLIELHPQEAITTTFVVIYNGSFALAQPTD